MSQEAIAPPTEEPLSKNAVASPRSRFGNHSETALVAAGQFPDSPAPRRKRKVAKLLSMGKIGEEEANGVVCGNEIGVFEASVNPAN